jgi:hypothetical protein
MRVSQILTEKLVNVKLNQSTFDIPLHCIFDIDLRSLIEVQSNLNLRASVISCTESLLSRASLKSNLKHRSTSILRREWRHLRKSHHILNPWWQWWNWRYGRNKRCYSCKWRKILASLGYVALNFVATNNENFKILKYMVNFYLRYKKKPRNTMQMQLNYIKWFFSKD